MSENQETNQDNSTDNLSNQPTPDKAEKDAFFPSPYSLSQYVPPKTDFDGVEHAGEYTEGKWKVLMIGAEERYLPMDNGTFFSTGNHPVETALPLKHLMEAGFEVEVATIGGNPVKFEWWAMPAEDQAVAGTMETLEEKFRSPKKLSDLAPELGADSPYLGVFIPGGHGTLTGLPTSKEVQQTLDWALDHDRFIVTLCHGPAALLASGLDREESRFAGYELALFPDSLDQGTNRELGYVPGGMPYLFGQELKKQGLTLVNDDMSGTVHQDRKLLTGDSPLAAHALGKLAADEFIKATSS